MPKDHTSESLLSLITEIYEQFKGIDTGKCAEYIPELGKADPSKFGIAITTAKGEQISVGDAETLFTIQSVSKPFVFGLALEKQGLELVRKRVGVEPTGEPFHSMIRLDSESKRPSNPMVNAGAIAMTSLIKDSSPERGQKNLLEAFERYLGRKIEINLDVYQSEKASGHRNRAIAHLMLHFDMVEPQIDDMVDLYFRQCSIEVSALDLSLMASCLANAGRNPVTDIQAIDPQYVKYLLTLMLTCGLYTYAGEWAFTVGIPAKSGVSGGILGVVPGEMGIGVYSPRVDSHGNSVRGVLVFKELTKRLKLHIFDSLE